MPLCVKELYKRGLNFPVIVGGAAINRYYGRRILFVDEQTPDAAPVPYDHGVFYARDAFEGLEIIDRLTSSPEQRASFIERIKEEALKERLKKTERTTRAAAKRFTERDSTILLSTAARARTALPGRLFCPGQQRQDRRGSFAGRDDGTVSH